MKTRSKKVGIIGIVIMVLLIAIAIVFDVLCATFSSYIGLFFRSSGNSVDAEQSIKNANDFTVTQEAEGLVLLKNEGNLLPLDGMSKVNLFGACSVKQLYLGTGSAGGWNWTSDAFVNLKTALDEQDIEVNEELWTFYESLSGSNSGMVGGVTDMQGSTHSIVDPNISSYDSNLLSNAQTYSDTAIIVIGRAGGEGSDAVMDMTPNEDKGQNINGDAGKHYLELQSVEKSMVDYVKANFKNVVLLVNTPMPVELGFVDEGTAGTDGKGNIDAAMWIGMPGSTGNRAVAQALKGELSPSGRLPDTWAYAVESAPSYYNFGNFTYGNAELTNQKYLHYEEGIYVGYRWYETANAEGVSITASNYHDDSNTFNFANYDDIVQYPFGSGLSYADFDIAWDGTPSYDSNTNEFTFKVKVTNTATENVSSKTPVEIYVEAPYTDGGIEKSKVVLAAFDKTDEIAKGASETLTITINRDQLASYDYITEKAYVLDSGDYKFYVDWGEYGSHCWANTSDTSDVLSWTYNLANKIVFDDEARDGDLVVATNQFDDVNMGDGSFTPKTDELTREDFVTSFPEDYQDNKDLTANTATSTRLTDKLSGATLQGYDPATYKYTGEFANADGSYKDPTSGYTALAFGQNNGLGCADLVGKEYGDEDWDKLLSQLSWAELQKLTGSCGWQNPAISSIKKKAGVDMDGAEGLHDLVNGTSTNCYACAPITAATFSKDVAYEFGSIYADEALTHGVTAIYGFSMNTHRSPFGGRAFEYYSEDGLLAGYIAAGQTSGLQDKGVTVFSKHFAANDQETNRSGVHTWLGEQAFREIYLKPYEIVTKTTTNKSDLLNGGTGIMTAYSSIGTSHASAHYPLLTNVLRKEWGFNGKVITDAFGWDSPSCSVRAGTDMFLGTAAYDSVDGMDNSKGYGLAKIQEAAKHQLFVFVNSAGISTDSGISNAWVAIPVVLSIVLIGGAIVIFVFMVYPAFFMKKKAA